VRLGGSKLIADTIRNIFIHVRAIRKMTIFQSDRRGALDRRSHADHRSAGAPRDGTGGKAGAPASLDLAAFVSEHCDFLD